MDSKDIELGFEAGINKAMKIITFGFLWVLIGVAITVVTYLSSLPTYLIFYGPVIVGVAQIAIGFFSLIGVKIKQRKYYSQQESGGVTNYNEYIIKKVDYESVSTLDKDFVISNRRIYKFGSLALLVIIVMLSVVGILYATGYIYDMQFDERIVGIWDSDENVVGHFMEDLETITFSEDKTYSADFSEMLPISDEYYFEGGKLKLLFSSFSETYYYDLVYSFSNDDNTLTLTDGNLDMVFTRQFTLWKSNNFFLFFLWNL